MPLRLQGKRAGLKMQTESLTYFGILTPDERLCPAFLHSAFIARLVRRFIKK